MSLLEGYGARSLAAIMLMVGCGPAPPPDAPTDVYYRGGKTPYWRHCVVDSSDRQVHCKIWIKHHLHRDEVFIPYDGGPTPAPEELKIIDYPLNPSKWIFLENRRLLIPVSMYGWSKELIEGEWAHFFDERGYVVPPSDEEVPGNDKVPEHIW